MATQLSQLSKFTTVVADSGDLNQIQQFKPTDATTNPTLILKAAKQPEYQHILQKIAKDNKNANSAMLSDQLLVAFGSEILKIIPGRVSTEIDARLSFDTQSSVERAKQIIDLYEKSGIERERVLIKLASTWEGIQAAKELQQCNINCNLTLMFSVAQAIAAAQAKATLISPFVGRIYDWYKKDEGESWVEDDNAGANDPGVISVKRIYNYYKTYNIPTQVMGASFRNKGQILALAGCDLLTISPQLLAELESSNEPVSRALEEGSAKELAPDWRASNEVVFRTDLNNNAMATEKLAEGIRLFCADALALDQLIAQATTNQ